MPMVEEMSTATSGAEPGTIGSHKSCNVFSISSMKAEVGEEGPKTTQCNTNPLHTLLPIASKPVSIISRLSCNAKKSPLTKNLRREGLRTSEAPTTPQSTPQAHATMASSKVSLVREGQIKVCRANGKSAIPYPKYT